MKFILSILSAVLLVAASHADESAVAHCKKHLLSILSYDLEGLKTSYAEKIHLLPGHEFTKPEHKLGGEDSRETGLTVTRDELLKAMKADIGDRKPRPKEAIEKKLGSVEYIMVKNEAGEFVTDPSDPINTEDGKLRMQLQEGDVVYKIAPPKGDFLLLHLRKAGDDWVVVSEYLD